MDWTKIKTKHFLFTKMNDREQAAFVRLLCLTAHLEKLPDHYETRQVCGQKTLESLTNRFQSDGKSLSNVLQKVLEDVGKVEQKRKRDRDYHRVYDNSRKRGAATNSRPREDKIREDKINTPAAAPDPLKESKKISLKDVPCKNLSEGAKHKVYNELANMFNKRGWKDEPEYIKSIFKMIVESMNGFNPREFFPYFRKAAVNWINRNAELIAADTRSWRKNLKTEIQGIKIS